jgi:glucose-1-phosphate thymidylyltransferase
VEEVAFRMGYIDVEQLRFLASNYLKNDYGRYLIEIADEEEGTEVA